MSGEGVEMKNGLICLGLASLLCLGCGATKRGSGGPGSEGDPCDGVLDCGPGLGCVDGVCTSLGDAEADAPEDGPADAPDAPADAPTDGADAGDAFPDAPADGAGDPTGDAGDDPCLYIPPATEFNPEMECFWNSSSVTPTRIDVVATPAVANITDDNGDTLVDLEDVPDIVFIAYDYPTDGCCQEPATLRVVSGRCGTDGHLPEHFSVTTPAVDNSGGVAVGDIDDDTLPEIVAARHPDGTVAFENDGTLKWESEDPDRDTLFDSCTAMQPTIADLDADGIAEVIAGRVVLDGLTGATLWRGVAGRGYNAFLGPISVVADIDLDTVPEVIAGNTAYRADGWIEWVYDYGTSLGSCSDNCALGCDGFNAIGDFDSDPYAEVVIVVAERLFVLEHDGVLKTMIDIPRESGYTGYNEGGPPTIADFDGDTRAEIGVAAANYYVVFDLDCTSPLPPECDSVGIRWKVENNDESSRVTGSSVFDFDGNGEAEVIYNDETDFRILSGVDGTILFEWDNFSHTRLEYPLIADVDNDGNAEILFIENRRGGDDPGLEVWGDAADTWVPTRRIWNQHAYHITNVDEDGAVPAFEANNWSLFNNYRQNLPDLSPYLAPDLVVEFVDVDTTPCTDHVDMTVRVCNIGDLRVGPGVQVRFYEGVPPAGPIACTPAVLTSTTLDPDDCELVTCSWHDPPVEPESADVTACVDDVDGTCAEPGGNHECNEDNNTALTEDVQCGLIG